MIGYQNHENMSAPILFALRFYTATAASWLPRFTFFFAIPPVQTGLFDALSLLILACPDAVRHLNDQEVQNAIVGASSIQRGGWFYKLFS